MYVHHVLFNIFVIQKGSQISPVVWFWNGENTTLGEK